MSENNLQDGAVPDPVTEAPSQEEVAALWDSSRGRFAPKAVESSNEEDDDAEDEHPQVKPPKDPNVVWLPHPSIPDQMQKMPNTIRVGPQVDAVFNLSAAGELAAFNLIQGKATDQIGGQTAVIHHMAKEFHQGQFFALVTYSQIFYQKI